MKTSEQGRAFLEHEEGIVLKAYLDAVGVPTIGVGHTGHDVTRADVERGLTWTREECDAALAADLRRIEAAVNNGCTAPPTQNQFDAFVSLAFNIGARGFADSTALRRFNSGDIAGAAEAFLMWRNAGGKPILLGRRIREKAVFLGKNQ